MFIQDDGTPVSGMRFTRVSIKDMTLDMPVYALVDFGSPIHITTPHFIRILGLSEASTLNAQMNEILIEDKLKKKGE